MIEQPPSFEALLSEREWLRRLALRLVVDSNDADDAVQETLVEGMSTTEAVRAPRAWLATVLRRRVARGRRTRSRREARERRAARQIHEVATVEEAAARAEISQWLIRAVLDLREPYRSAILLVHYGDLSAEAAAKRLGVRPETIRSRVHRGIQQLRTRLAREHGGSHWRSVVVGAYGLEKWTTSGVSGVSSSVAAAAIALFVLGGWLVVASFGEREFTPQRQATFRPESEPESPTSTIPPQVVATRTPTVESNQTPRAADSVLTVPIAPPELEAEDVELTPWLDSTGQPRMFRVHGVVVDIEGRPMEALDLDAALMDWDVAAEQGVDSHLARQPVQTHGLRLTDPSGLRTDSSGRFDFEAQLLIPNETDGPKFERYGEGSTESFELNGRTLCVRVAVASDGHHTVLEAYSPLGADPEILVVGARNTLVRGRVVDSDGRGLPGLVLAVSQSAWRTRRTESSRYTQLYPNALYARTDQQGHFEFAKLPDGDARELKINRLQRTSDHSRSYSWRHMIQRVTELPSGEITGLVIELDGLCRASLSGQVHRPMGEPAMEDASLRVGSSTVVPIDASGRFEASLAIKKGEFQTCLVTLRVPGHEEAQRVVRVRCEERAWVDLEPGPPEDRSRFLLTTPEGDSADEYTASVAGQFARVEPDGSFDFEKLSPGSHKIRLRGGGTGIEFFADVEVSAGSIEPVVVDPPFTEYGELGVRVVGVGGVPVAGALVHSGSSLTANWGGGEFWGRRARGRTNDRGIAELDSVIPAEFIPVAKGVGRWGLDEHVYRAAIRVRADGYITKIHVLPVVLPSHVTISIEEQRRYKIEPEDSQIICQFLNADRDTLRVVVRSPIQGEMSLHYPEGRHGTGSLPETTRTVLFYRKDAQGQRELLGERPVALQPGIVNVIRIPPEFLLAD